MTALDDLLGDFDSTSREYRAQKDDPNETAEQWADRQLRETGRFYTDGPEFYQRLFDEQSARLIAASQEAHKIAAAINTATDPHVRAALIRRYDKAEAEYQAADQEIRKWSDALSQSREYRRRKEKEAWAKAEAAKLIGSGP